ncbi:MAG TPA: hypothetical protein VGR90_07530 [Acidimicrobiales bacterium]|nr:hypothetical protein [Acidimicrobiales bacterium]
MADLDGIRARLETLAEELADAALDSLREAVGGRGDADDERRITRARRAVERAVAILGGGAEEP